MNWGDLENYTYEELESFRWYEFIIDSDWTKDGYINADDWNRIEANIADLADYLRSIQYNIPLLTAIKDRTKKSIDFLSSINRIEQNLEDIKTRFLRPDGYRDMKSWGLGDGFSYDDVNRLESNIKLLTDFGIITRDNFRYCGTQTCGEQGVIY